MIESSLGIVGACLPLLKPIFVGISTQNIFSSLRSWPLLGQRGESVPKDHRYGQLEAGNMTVEKKEYLDTKAATPWVMVD